MLIDFEYFCVGNQMDTSGFFYLIGFGFKLKYWEVKLLLR